jgi:DNA polymerase-1
MSSGAAGKLYLVDAFNLIFQVFHAIRGMSSPSGMPTNALFGFLRDILYLRGLSPDYLVVAFDREEPTFRSDLAPEYKAHREPPPDDLVLQLPLIEQALSALRIPVVSHPRYEADDIMATIARAGEARGLDVYLCTSDKDCRQLISDRVRLFSLRKREELGIPQLLDDWGIRPDQVVDLQALVGDSVDNVPGVPGIGIKTAATLLREFGTLDNLYANLDKVTGKKRQSLQDAAQTVLLSRKLVTLACDVPIPLDWDAWKIHPIETERMLALCQEWGFRGLANQVRALATSQPAPAKTDQPGLFGSSGEEEEDTPPPASPEEELFPFGANVAEPPQPPANAPAPWGADYRLVDTQAALDQLASEMRKQKRIAIDTETTGLDPMRADLVGVSVCWKDGAAHYIPVRGPMGCATLPLEEVREKLAPLLADPSLAKVGQNVKYDLLVLRRHGMGMEGVDGDPMLAHYLLEAGSRSHGIDELTRRYLGHTKIATEELIGKKKPKSPQLVMDQVETRRVADYACEDADAAWRLAGHLEGELAKPGNEALLSLYRDMEVPLAQVLADMEEAGIGLDSAYLKKLSEEMAQQMLALEEEAHALAGHKFNLASLPQVRKVLFEEMGMPVQARTSTTGEPSTDQESLEKLAALGGPGADLCRKLLAHRQVAKLKGTYVDALPALVHPHDGRLHTSYSQVAAVTGRLSSSDPNLQNIPVRRENGEQVRRAFLPRPGWLLLTADYSQIELRVLAQACGDEVLRRAFAEGRDVHTEVAARVFDVHPSTVTSEQRRMAKVVNFGVIYGISASGLAQRLQMKKDAAAAFIKAYFAQYPRVEAYQAELLASTRRLGYATTLLGRRRAFDVTALRPHSSPMDRNTAEREVINMQVQGTAADLIKLAMLAVSRRIAEMGMQSRLLLQIHDELVFEAPPSELEALKALVSREMTEPPAQRLGFTVPLSVDLASGPNWLDVS